MACGAAGQDKTRQHRLNFKFEPGVQRAPGRHRQTGRDTDKTIPSTRPALGRECEALIKSLVARSTGRAKAMPNASAGACPSAGHASARLANTGSLDLLQTIDWCRQAYFVAAGCATGQVIIWDVSTHTFLTDPSDMGRERQLSAPSQSACP